ncbi:unnamed protein product, partial [marine sediment metagenome]
MKSWAEIWEKKAHKGETPAEISGFMEKDIDKILFKMVRHIKYKLRLKPHDTLFEVGCGAGMLLPPLLEYCKQVGGCDFSPTMVKQAKKFIPKGKFSCAEANCLKGVPDDSYSRVLCNSVFQYFPDHEYANQAVKEMIRICKSKGFIMIMDIPNNYLKKQAEEHRKKLKKKKNPGRLYYSKDFFEKMLRRE